MKKLIGAIILSCVLGIIVSISLYQYSSEEEDFIFISQIIKENTDEFSDPIQKLKNMTLWFKENVKHTSQYPKDFNGKGVVNVIHSGMGNCEFQSCNIALVREYLGFPEHRIIHNRKEWGAPGQHAFAEIKIEDRWIIFDPDYWEYVTCKKGKLLGISDIYNFPHRVQDDKIRDWIITTVKNKGYKIGKSWQKTPKPYGEEGYIKYEKYGKLYVYSKIVEKEISTIAFTSIISLLLFLGFFKVVDRKRQK